MTGVTLFLSLCARLSTASAQKEEQRFNYRGKNIEGFTLENLSDFIYATQTNEGDFKHKIV